MSSTKKRSTSRRQLLKTLAAGATGIAGARVGSSPWTPWESLRPLMDSVVVPAHAQTARTAPTLRVTGIPMPGWPHDPDAGIIIAGRIPLDGQPSGLSGAARSTRSSRTREASRPVKVRLERGGHVATTTLSFNPETGSFVGTLPPPLVGAQPAPLNAIFVDGHFEQDMVWPVYVTPPQETLSAPGNYTTTVQPGIVIADVITIGASGQDSGRSDATNTDPGFGGGPAWTQARMIVTPGETLDLFVGQSGGPEAGFGGAPDDLDVSPQNQPGGAGGESSYVLRSSTGSWVVAGGGGGGGGHGNRHKRNPETNDDSGGGDGGNGSATGEDGAPGLGVGDMGGIAPGQGGERGDSNANVNRGGTGNLVGTSGFRHAGGGGGAGGRGVTPDGGGGGAGANSGSSGPDVHDVQVIELGTTNFNNGNGVVAITWI